MHPADHALPLPSTPGPNICNKPASPSINASPAIYNTPSKLEWFLQAVERNGVPGVETFHPMLSAKGYGPDIMHLINICDLEKIGMPLGDAIRLKKYAARWWSDECRLVAKCPRDAETANTIRPVAELTHPHKRLCFEKRYNEGGATRLWGPAIKAGSWDDDADYTWWVHSDELNMDVPLPRDRVPILEEDE